MMNNTDCLPEVYFDPCQVETPQDCACPPPVTYVTRQENAMDSSSTGDCACPPHAAGVQPFEPAGTRLYRAPEELIFQPLQGGYETVYNPVWPGGFAVINSSARHLLNTYRLPRPLPPNDEPPVEVHLARAGLLRPVFGASCTIKDNPPETLTVWLHLTGRCNLSCQYCYVTKSSQTMTLETGCQAVRTLFCSAQAHGFRRIQLKYAGGEPTLAFSTLLAIQSLAVKLSEAEGMGLDGVVLSNGIGITPKMIEQMRDKRLRLSLSLDGWGADHDQQRMQSGGKGSFDLVRHTLDIMARENINPSITITLTRRNLAGLPDLVNELLQRQLPFNFNFYRENGCSDSAPELGYDVDEMIAGLRAAFAIIAKHPPKHSLLSALLDRSRMDYLHHYPCGVGLSYIVVGAHGDLSRCHMEMDQVFGHITDPDPLASVFNAVGGVQNPNVDTKPECRACELRYACAGGCPQANFKTFGAYDSRSPNCQIYRTLYREVLTLEGLRLLSQFGIVVT